MQQTRQENTRAGAIRGKTAARAPRLTPLALACLLACALPRAYAANCDAGDFAALSACIGAAGAGDTITLTADITAGGALPAVNNNVTLVNNGHTLTSGGLSKTGSGTLTLDGANNITGTATLSGGTLVIGDPAALGTANLQISGGALRSTQTATYNTPFLSFSGDASIAAAAGTTLTLPGTISSVGGTTYHFGSATDTGTVLFTGNWTLASAGITTYIDGGTLKLTSVGGTAIIGPSVLHIAAGATLETSFNTGVTSLNGAGSVLLDGAVLFAQSGNYGGVIRGSGRVEKTSTSTLTLTGANTYAGTTNITAGTVQVGNGGASGTLGAGNVIDNGALVFNRSDTHTVANHISGSGTVTQAGSGTTILLGANSYTGVTTISGGTLQIGDGGTSGSLGNGNAVILGAASTKLVFDRAGTLVVNNSIGGGGQVVQNGSGTLRLTGTSSQTGGFTLSNGRVEVINQDALGWGEVRMDGGTLAALNNFTLDGGAPGTQTLRFAAGKASTVTVATGSQMTINPDAMVFGDNATVTFGSAAEAGSFRMGPAPAMTVGNNVAIVLGGGNFRSDGAVNRYTDATASFTIEAPATLNLRGGAATIGNLQGAGTVDSASLAQVRGGNFSGSFTNVAQLEKIDTGTLILTGSNSHGTTTISGGTLQIGNGGGTGTLGTGAVTNNGALVFNRNNTYSVANAISGTGALTQAGSGNLILLGINTYTGATNVNSGLLSVNGSTGASAVTVNNGGTLGGNGTLGATTVMSGGVLAPGNSIGTLTVNGNLTFNPGSIYRVETDAAGNADRVNVVGAPGTLALNGGTVDVRAGGGNYQRNTQYTILNASGGRSGAFAGVTSNLAFLTPTLVYDANNVYLNLLSANAPAYTSVAQTPNQRSVAGYLTGFANQPGNAQAAGLIRQIDNLSADQARNAFDSLSGSQHASATQTGLALTRGFGDALAARLGDPAADGRFGAMGALRDAAFGPGSAALPWGASADAPAQLAGLFAAPGAALPATGESGMAASADSGRGAGAAGGNGLWSRALGAGGRIAGDGNGAGSSYRAGGFMLGYDQAVSDAWLVGAAGGYQRAGWDASSNGIAPANGRVETPQGALFARHARGRWTIWLSGSYAEHRFDTRRTVSIGTAASTASSNHRGREWTFSARAEYALAAGAWQVRPVAGVRHSQLREDAFTESGAGAGSLSVAARRTESTTVSGGVRLLRPFGKGGAATGGFELRALVAHLFGANDAPVCARLAGQAASFSSAGTPLRRDALTVGAGVSGQLKARLTAFADASFETRGSGQTAFALGAGLRYLW